MMAPTIKKTATEADPSTKTNSVILNNSSERRVTALPSSRRKNKRGNYDKDDCLYASSHGTCCIASLSLVACNNGAVRDAAVELG